MWSSVCVGAPLSLCARNKKRQGMVASRRLWEKASHHQQERRPFLNIQLQNSCSVALALAMLTLGRRGQDDSFALTGIKVSRVTCPTAWHHCLAEPRPSDWHGLTTPIGLCHASGLGLALGLGFPSQALSSRK
jgi:hypothetical protein